MISGALSAVIFFVVFQYLSTRERWLDLGIGLVFILISIRMVAEGIPGLIKKYENRQGFMDLNVALPMALGSLLGANMGAMLSKRVSFNTLKFVFGIVFSYVSVKFISSFLRWCVYV